MSMQAEKRARAEAMLGELAEVSLTVAKELAVRLRECEDVDRTVALAGAFQKMSRVVRLTLALDFKLERDAAREVQALAREAEKARTEPARATAFAPRPARTSDPIEFRKDRVRSLMSRLLWNESEGEELEYEIRQDELTERLDEAALSPDFETAPIETLARRMIAQMSLSGELTLSAAEPKSPSPPPGLGPAPSGASRHLPRKGEEGEGVRRTPDG
jgi:hypothetical protein